MARQARANPGMRWIDDRLHVSGVVEAALSHPVPKRVHPLDYLGEATLFVFLNQMVTGILLAMFYNASAHTPYSYDPNTGKATPTIAWSPALRTSPSWPLPLSRRCWKSRGLAQFRLFPVPV